MDRHRWLDALYGQVSLEGHVAKLCQLPVVQRMRHIRLSNIDSLSTPGIAGTSRFEHAMGTAFLASKAKLTSQLDEEEKKSFIAAALLHDSALAPFGHLVEEAFSYSGTDFNHEEKWASLLANEEEDLGGVGLQIYCGRESGILQWAFDSFPHEVQRHLDLIFKIIMGHGVLGKALVGDIDLDNLDNVVRAAYHMGLDIDKELPLRVSQSISLNREIGDVIFSTSAKSDIETWAEYRERVYSNFILSEVDFAGKIMLLSATSSALKSGCFQQTDWRFSDSQHIERLLACSNPDIKEPVRRWLLGDLWSLSTPTWFLGTRPPLKEIDRFNSVLTEELKRPCFGYPIKDKRSRHISVALEDGGRLDFGKDSRSWIFAVGSPTRVDFSEKDGLLIARLVRESFGSEIVGETRHQRPLPLF